MPRNKKPLIHRLLEKLVYVENSGCVEYSGAIDHAGYGRIGLGGRADGIGYTHRLMYEWAKSEIPNGLHIDHLCRNRACCRPDHLEAVTQAENNRRASRDNPSTACRRGHEYAPGTYYQTPKQKFCRICIEIRRAERKAS